MTMLWQESTLFGGWAKAQTPPPIEIGVEKSSDMLSYSIWPNKENLQISLTIEKHPQLGSSEPEEQVPALWLRREFLQRWAYARQMRADLRLLAVIKFFTRRIRRPNVQSKQVIGQAEKGNQEPVTATSTMNMRFLHSSRIGQQVTSNPVVQEAMRIFGATITDIELVQKPSATSAYPDSRHLPEISAPPETIAQQQPQNLWNALGETSLDPTVKIKELETKVHILETQLRRRELEKEALRRQVKRLGGDKPWA